MDSNHRRRALQTRALPTELPPHSKNAVRTGLEPVTSGVTGRHSKPTELTHRIFLQPLASHRLIAFPLIGITPEACPCQDLSLKLAPTSEVPDSRSSHWPNGTLVNESLSLIRQSLVRCICSVTGFEPVPPAFSRVCSATPKPIFRSIVPTHYSPCTDFIFGIFQRQLLTLCRCFRRAEDGIRTRDPDLGKVVLYQLSYFRVEAFLG